LRPAEGLIMTAQFNFDNSYIRLPETFYRSVLPSSARDPRLIKLNRPLADLLRLDAAALEAPEGVEILAGKRLAEGSQPIATAYAGHQFGGFSPQLGDGRAILLGEVLGRDGIRRDIQLKGSGATPFSRGGDGRAALGPVLREYLVSEAMAALGIPTTRALAALTTGETVYREVELPGAVLVRVATSHIRVGTFQFFAARGDMEAVRHLADHAIARHDPKAAAAADPYRAFLDGVIARQARLIARWMHIGFIHGVMNTDNMSVSGETIDYGPCAFMDAYDPATVFSSIDRGGRYAYQNQPGIALWNLTRLAECLLPLLGDGEEAGVAAAEEALKAFAPTYLAALLDGYRAKLGLPGEQEGDDALVIDLLNRMAAGKADFTLTFRRLCDAAADPERDREVRDLFIDTTAYDAWAKTWRARLGTGDGSARRTAMLAVNPAFVPRNHRVEEVIEAAISRGDFEPFERLGQVMARPYEDQPDHAAYAEPPAFDTSAYKTFCGT
jgi:serine/tyrosine/threonine adenylyltransferase